MSMFNENELRFWDKARLKKQATQLFEEKQELIDTVAALHAENLAQAVELARVREDAQKDYDGMRDMQAKVIQLTHALNESQQQVARLEGELHVMTDKCKGLCVAHGNLLIEHHDVKVDRDRFAQELEGATNWLEQLTEIIEHLPSPPSAQINVSELYTVQVLRSVNEHLESQAQDVTRLRAALDTFRQRIASEQTFQHWDTQTGRYIFGKVLKWLEEALAQAPARRDNV